MSRPHRIHLQAAWNRAAGGTVWTRPFGRPTGIGAGGRVCLVVARPAACSLTLNGRRLPTVATGGAAWRHDVTADLRERNELRLDAGVATGEEDAEERVPLPATLGSVWLEILSGA